MARTQFDPPPANTTDLAYRVNEHSVALDKLLPEGSSTPSAPYADGTLTGFDVVDLLIVVADHASQDLDFVIPFKCEVLNAKLKKTANAAGANANTVQLQTAAGAGNITDAMSLNGVARGGLVSAANIDDTGNAVILAGGTLRLHIVKAGGDAAFRAQISVVPRA